MNIIRKLRWMRELLARFPTCESYEDWTKEAFLTGYEAGTEHPADQLRKGLAKQFPEFK